MHRLRGTDQGAGLPPDQVFKHDWIKGRWVLYHLGPYWARLGHIRPNLTYWSARGHGRSYYVIFSRGDALKSNSMGEEAYKSNCTGKDGQRRIYVKQYRQRRTYVKQYRGETCLGQTVHTNQQPGRIGRRPKSPVRSSLMATCPTLFGLNPTESRTVCLNK